MKSSQSLACSSICIVCIWLGMIGNSYGMGLRSFVALPIEKDGGVMRLALERMKKTETDTLMTSVAYGFSANQTLLMGIPYRLSPSGSNRQGDISALYRHTVWQSDYLSGTDRLAVLGGVIVSTENDRDNAIQTGFVFTHFKNRHEIDIDGLYQLGMGNRADQGRYDLSWQYRLLPIERPEWGMTQEINSVLELNGRWREGNNTTHQLTAGLQWIHQKLVIESGVVKDINNENEVRYILSTRFHF